MVAYKRVIKLSFELQGKPNERILLRHLATKHDCRLLPMRDAGSPSIIEGDDIDKLTLVRSSFNALRSQAMLKCAIVVASNPGTNPREVETAFMRAFVRRSVELLNDPKHKASSYRLKEPLYSEAGVQLAEQIFEYREGDDIE